jgi:hypothetical protein
MTDLEKRHRLDRAVSAIERMTGLEGAILLLEREVKRLSQHFQKRPEPPQARAHNQETHR